MRSEDSPVVAFLNGRAGSADAARKALESAEAFDIRETDADAMTQAIRETVESGAKRVLVCGGDGTIASAAHVLAGTGVELAVLPGGTLNHFARDHHIPTDLAKALAAARGEEFAEIDVGYVGDKLFLNTFSVGMYVGYVRTRDRLEKRLGYRLASVIAVLRTFIRMYTMSVELEVEGRVRRYKTALVFVGVGERELKAPKLGARIEGGRQGLHVIIVTGRRRASTSRSRAVTGPPTARAQTRTPRRVARIRDVRTTAWASSRTARRLALAPRSTVNVMRPAASGAALSAVAPSRSTRRRPRNHGGDVTVVVPEPARVSPRSLTSSRCRNSSGRRGSARTRQPHTANSGSIDAWSNEDGGGGGFAKTFANACSVTSVSFATETHMSRTATLLDVDPYELRLKNANRVGDTSPNQIVYTDPSTVPTILAIADAVGHELEPAYREMTRGPRSGDLLPEHLVAQLADPDDH
mgnify:CR=1 FL=1